jgi:hypothetical protein
VAKLQQVMRAGGDAQTTPLAAVLVNDDAAVGHGRLAKIADGVIATQ